MGTISGGTAGTTMSIQERKAVAALRAGIVPIPYKTLSGVLYRAADWAKSPPVFYCALDGHSDPIEALAAAHDELPGSPESGPSCEDANS